MTGLQRPPFAPASSRRMSIADRELSSGLGSPSYRGRRTTSLPWPPNPGGHQWRPQGSVRPGPHNLTSLPQESFMTRLKLRLKLLATLRRSFMAAM